MKQDSIQELLAKRAAGTLTDDELTALNALAGRDEVVAGAERRAVAIRGRRRRVAAMVAGVVAVVAVGLTLLMPRHEEPLMAKQEPPKQQVVADEVLPATVEAAPVQVAAVSTGETAAAVPHKQKQQPKAAQAGEPVVTCNSQCDADSVINDIWKFLTA